jgi:alpha-glucosidase (family GH31 glycosyl hydrolase)
MQGRDANEKTFNDILNHLDQNNIPITVFHFDFDGWETCPNNGQFSWSDSLLQRMRTHNPTIRGLFWILPLIKKGCAEFNTGTAAGYFVRNRDGSPLVTSSWQGTGSWIDFKNPQAVAFWHSLLDRIFARAAGVIGGFYTDDVRPDLGNDSSYSDAFTRDLLDYTRSKLPDGEVVLKRYGANTPDDAFLARYGHATYVNDLDGSFAGLREGIRRVFATSTLTPAPFNEFTGYSNTTPDAETYIRRMHWGAFQPVMENDNLSTTGFPWDAHYPSQVLQAYRYYTNLHWELAPYFHTYDEIAYLNNWPIFQQPNPARYSTVLGREFFVQYVTDYVQSMNVSLPAGQWINYWNEQEMHTGPATIPVAVPPGREPIWIANGAIIPMQVRDNSTGHGTTASSGALTVNVFPHGHSLFSYFDLNQKWLLLDMNQSGNSVTLCTSAPPSQPVIYRVGRWTAAPNRVAQLNGAVGINVSWGTPIPVLGNETAVDASAGGWYYDAARQHLIVKLTRVGNYCPRNVSSLLSGSLSTSK